MKAEDDNKPKRTMSKEREADLADLERGHRGAQFEVQAQLRISQFAPERGVSMFAVPEIEARKSQIEEAMKRGVDGPEGEQGKALAIAFVEVNIYYYLARLQDVTSEGAIRSCRDNLNVFNKMWGNIVLIRTYLNSYVQSLRLDAAKCQIAGNKDRSAELIQMADNCQKLADSLIETE